MNLKETMDFIDQFENQYQYDCDYMREMVRTSPGGYQAFADGRVSAESSR